MKHNLSSRIVPFLAIVIFIMIHLPVSLCAINEQYERCGRIDKCGNITITYPFVTTWERANRDRPYYCGSSKTGFQLHCRNDEILTMNIKEITYRFLAINDSARTATVVLNDYWDTYYCPTAHRSTTLDSHLFSYVESYSNILMYYGCPSNINITGFANQQFTCVVGNGTNTTLGYSLLDDTTDRNSSSVTILPSCQNYVIIPAFTSDLQTLHDSPSQENLIAAIHGGFDITWQDADSNLCKSCVETGGLCGSNVISSKFTCYCPDMPYPYICQILVTGSSSNLNIKLKLAIGISAAVAGSIIVVFALCLLRREDILYKPTIFWRKKTKNDLDVDAFIKDNGSLLALKQYRYSDVKKITKSFTDKLGQGGYRCVYGKLLDGCLVAVKVLNESKGNGEEFLNEVASISRTSHVNVVSLLGFCYERTKRALIYEFMPNGSLDQFIYIGKSSITNSQLEWKTLYQIAVGIARGLEYLHIGCNMRILHFDIKPHNILLDEEFCPKISDFGLAKLYQRKESIISMQGPRGTAGYIAPEVFNRHFGGVSIQA